MKMTIMMMMMMMMMMIHTCLLSDQTIIRMIMMMMKMFTSCLDKVVGIRIILVIMMKYCSPKTNPDNNILLVIVSFLFVDLFAYLFVCLCILAYLHTGQRCWVRIIRVILVIMR